MSLAPGVTISAAGRLFATIGPGTVANFYNQGIGLMANQSVAMDTNAPAGTIFNDGYAVSANGALYVKVATQLATDVWVGGLRTSILGQIIVESADAVTYCNGNGITAAGNLSVN
jgi:hypothetical protein